MNTKADKNISASISVDQDRIKIMRIATSMKNFIDNFFSKYTPAAMSAPIIKYSKTKIQIGGLLTIFSKQILRKVRKKKIVKSKNTTQHKKVMMGVELY